PSPTGDGNGNERNGNGNGPDGNGDGNELRPQAVPDPPRIGNDQARRDGTATAVPHASSPSVPGPGRTRRVQQRPPDPHAPPPPPAAPGGAAPAPRFHPPRAPAPAPPRPARSRTGRRVLPPAHHTDGISAAHHPSGGGEVQQRPRPGGTPPGHRYGL